MLPGRRTALIVCHAMSIAITVVLHAPVAGFSASRINSRLASLFAAASNSRFKIYSTRLRGPEFLERFLGSANHNFKLKSASLYSFDVAVLGIALELRR